MSHSGEDHDIGDGDQWKADGSNKSRSQDLGNEEDATSDQPDQGQISKGRLRVSSTEFDEPNRRDNRCDEPQPSGRNQWLPTKRGPGENAHADK